MKKLIMLELNKFDLKKYIYQVMIANVSILILVLLTAFMNNIGGLQGVPAIKISIVVDTLVKAVFIVWQSVLIATLIVEEFRSKTILILFTYPINRKLLMVSKLVLICIITLISTVVSLLFIHFILYGLNGIMPFIAFEITGRDIAIMLITTLTSTMLGLLPLYVGMINKSTVATVVSSLIIVGMTVSTSTEAGGVITIIPVSVTLGMIGAFMAYLSIRKILSEDLTV